MSARGGAGEFRVQAVLEVNGEVVDPSVPQYWWPREQEQVPEQVPDWSGWRELGMVDDVPDAFRRRQPAVIDLNPGRFAAMGRDARAREELAEAFRRMPVQGSW